MPKSKTKLNPRRIPRSQADVDKAYHDGAADMMHILLFTIGTDMEVSDEWLDKFHDRFAAHMAALKAGYITTDDMRRTTFEERGWETDIP